MSLRTEDKVKINGGKWKKHWGYLKTISATFSQVEVHHFTQSKSAGDPEDVVEKKVCRVKNIYLEKFPEMVWDMPTADQLQPVGPDHALDDCPNGAPLVIPDRQSPVPTGGIPVKVEEIIEEGVPPETEKMIQDVVDEVKTFKPPPITGAPQRKPAFSVEEALSEHESEGDPVDITADLPSMDEALLLRQKVYDLERACRIKDLIIEKLVLPS